MPREQKIKYFAYHDGFDPSILRLGNIALDYANPEDHRPYRNLKSQELMEDPLIVTKSPRETCYLIHDQGRVHSLGAGAAKLAELNISGNADRFQAVVASTGMVIEIIELVPNTQYLTRTKREI
jgi:hypothetical protein